MSSLFGGGQTGQTAGQGSSAGTVSTTQGQSSGNYAGGFMNSRGGQFLASALSSGGRTAGPLSQYQQGPSQIEQALGNRDTLKTALQIPQTSAQQIFAEAIQRARRI